MKTNILAAILLFLATAAPAFADDPIEKKLQQALFAEEGTRDLDKAIEAYNAVIADYDTQRKFAATAMFRLAECHRKLDEKAPAIAAYQRLLREFPEEQTLTRLAAENLATLGANTADSDSPAPATLATEAAEIARIKNLVALSPDLINDPESALLHKAAAKSQLQVANFLLDSGADINLRGGDRLPAGSGFNAPVATPVSVAASFGHLAMVKLLLERGAEVDDFTIYSAGFRKRAAVMDVLIDHLPDDPYMQFHALRAACYFGRPDFVSKLVAASAPFTSPSGNWSSPLQLCVEQRDLESIKILIEGGAIPDEDILLLATQSGVKIFQPIWESGVRSPNALRIAMDDADIAKIIIAGTDDIDQADDAGATALGLTSNALNPDLLRAVLERGAAPDQRLSIPEPKLEDITPLIVALNSSAHTGSVEIYESSLVEVIDLLIAAGADIDARDGNGFTALLWATSPRAAGRQIPLSAVRKILAQNPASTGIGGNDKALLASPYLADPGLRQIAYYSASKLAGRQDHLWMTNGTSYYEFPPQPMKLAEIVFDNAPLFDLDAIPIIRAGEAEPVMIDYAEMIASGEVGRDPVVHAGDILLGQDDSKNPRAPLSSEQLDYLTAAASKQITVRHGAHQWHGSARPGERPDHVYDPSVRIVYAKTVKTFLDSIYAPSSDLSRIEVKHSDGEVTLFNYLIASATQQSDLALRDGDEITLTPVEAIYVGDHTISLGREADLFLRPFEIGQSSGGGISLAEFIAAVYSDGSSVLPSPDFANITIRRQSGSVQPDLEQVFARQAIPLLGGDIVEIPSLSEPQADWQQLDGEIIEKLQAALGRSASFLLNADSLRTMSVGPQFFRFPPSDDLRSIEPLATPGDAGFEVLGLAAEAAVRMLGYQPNDQLSVGFQIDSGGDIGGFHEIRDDSSGAVYPFPIVEPDTTIEIQFRANSRPGPPARAPRPRLPTPASNQPMSRPPSPVNPATPKRESGRRVILPPRANK
jgi:ankyrin repeat protein